MRSQLKYERAVFTPHCDLNHESKASVIPMSYADASCDGHNLGLLVIFQLLISELSIK